MSAPPYVSRGAKYLILVLPLLLIFTYININDYAAPFAAPERYHRPLVPIQRPSYDDQTDWWIDFFTRLQTTRVDAPPIVVEGRAPCENWRPDINDPRPE